MHINVCETLRQVKHASTMFVLVQANNRSVSMNTVVRVKLSGLCQEMYTVMGVYIYHASPNHEHAYIYLSGDTCDDELTTSILKM